MTVPFKGRLPYAGGLSLPSVPAGVTVPYLDKRVGLPRFPSDPLFAYNFALEIDGLLVGGFTDIQGLGSRLTTESLREGGVNDRERQLPTGSQVDNLVLRRGLSGSNQLWDWYKAAVDGDPQRRNGTILVLGRTWQEQVSWIFRDALPVAWRGPHFAADTDAVAFEELELVHEGWSRVELGWLKKGANLAVGSGLGQSAVETATGYGRDALGKAGIL